MKAHRLFSALIAALIFFAALARGAHDLWAATLVYVVVLLLAAAFLIYSRSRPDHPPIRYPLICSAVLFLLPIAISFLRSVNPAESFLGLMDWVAAIILFLLAANVFSGDDTPELLLRILVPCFWIQLVVNLHQFNSDYVRLLPEIGGTLVNANIQSAFLLFWVPPLLERFRAARAAGGRGQAIYWASGWAAVFFSLFLTQSAWALVCLLVSAPWLLNNMMSPRLKKILIPLLVIGAVAVLIYKVIGNPLGRVAGRMQWWQAAWNMFLDHPFVGVGIGNYPSAFLAYKPGPGENSLFAHSFPLQLLAETGVIGALLVVLFLYFWWKKFSDSYESMERRAYFHGACLFLLFSLISLGTEYLVNLLTLAVFLGITSRAGSCILGRPRWSAVLVAGAVVLGAIPFLLSPFMASRHWVDGQNQFEEGNLDSAEKAFNNAISLDARAWEPYQGLAAIAAFKGDFAQAVELQQQALARNRLSPVLARELADYERRLR